MRIKCGFTLIEVAVALAIITLVLGTIMAPLASHIEQRQYSDTRKSLDEIKEALTGYALANGHLPCPDQTTASGTGIPNDGHEDVKVAGTCVTTEGNVPWADLSTAAADAWGNRFRYKVTTAFAQRSPAALFSLSSAGGITVNCPLPGCNPSYTYTSATPAVVLSHGKNGYGAISAANGIANPAPLGIDELENTNGNATFISRPQSTVGATSGEFDDVVAWISPNILFNRMVAAARLP